jgi:N-acetylmuramoyl-L-alanine amidase
METRRRGARPLVIVWVNGRRLAVLLTLALVAAVVGGALAAVRHRPPVPQPLAGHTVALDPGHGGIDSGAINSQSPLSEKELTLDVAQRLSRLIRQAGGRAVLTRTDDWESDLPDRQELRRRAGIAVEGRAELFLSLHVDSHADATCRYGQIFYHPSSAEGKRLALALQVELLRLAPDNYRRAGPAGYFLLGCTRLPSVLVELGFLSHPEERALLNKSGYREELARALCRGIIAYFASPPALRIPPLAPTASTPTTRLGVPRTQDGQEAADPRPRDGRGEVEDGD